MRKLMSHGADQIGRPIKSGPLDADHALLPKTFAALPSSSSEGPRRINGHDRPRSSIGEQFQFHGVWINFHIRADPAEHSPDGLRRAIIGVWEKLIGWENDRPLQQD